jgi:hypothetical protein
MHELLGGVVGERLELADYRADFAQRFWRIDQLGFWKLERQQFFQEPGDDSWEAFARGEWDEALRLIEARRANLEAEHRKIAEHGFRIQRVRVVEEPIIPYLQWELYLLRLREQCGSRIRVVTPAQLTRYETAGPLPEMCTLGTRVLYEVLYDEQGVLDGARRYTDPTLVRSSQRLIAELYEIGEPLADYFARRVANLPAPASQASV